MIVYVFIQSMVIFAFVDKDEIYIRLIIKCFEFCKFKNTTITVSQIFILYTKWDLNNKLNSTGLTYEILVTVSFCLQAYFFLLTFKSFANREHSIRDMTPIVGNARVQCVQW